jgi:hypothetical protein
MNFLFHLFRLQSSPSQRDSESVHIATTADVNWNRPVFRAPALPTHHQFNSELPFSVNFRAKDRSERKSA